MLSQKQSKTTDKQTNKQTIEVSSYAKTVLLARHKQN